MEGGRVHHAQEYSWRLANVLLALQENDERQA